STTVSNSCFPRRYSARGNGTYHAGAHPYPAMNPYTVGSPSTVPWCALGLASLTTGSVWCRARKKRHRMSTAAITITASDQTSTPVSPVRTNSPNVAQKANPTVEEVNAQANEPTDWDRLKGSQRILRTPAEARTHVCKPTVR